MSSAARCATNCSACRCRTATTWWSAPRPSRWSAQGFRPVGKDFPVFLHPDTQEEYALARTERKTAPGYHGFVFHTDARRHAGRGPGAARPDHQRHRAGRGRHPGRSVRRPARPAGPAVPPRVAGVRRRPGAHPARGPLRRALSRLHGGAGDQRADAADGRRRRGRRAGAGARLAGTGARPDGSQAVAHVRGAARLRRAGAHPARAGRAVGRAAAAAAPSGNRHRRARDAGDRRTPPAAAMRCRCALPP